MTMPAWIALWDVAFEHPVTMWIVGIVFGGLGVAAIVIGILSLSGRISQALRRELWLRLRSWIMLVPLMILPVLAGKVVTIAAVAVLGVLCMREYDRATGLFREKLLCFVIATGIVLVNFAALDHWYHFFVALIPLTLGFIALATIPLDRPTGYIQRVALGMLAYVLFGASLAHLSYMANDHNYRPIILMLLLAVALNDVFAFTAGKLIGGPKLLPHTSPNKTMSGALGALIPTTLIVAFLARAIFPGTSLDRWPVLIGLGLIVGAVGQLGDLMLSSVKRDLGIKDMGVVIPGHGGILDRFNSILLVPSAVFHYVGYFVGFGLDQPTRVITGG